MFTHKVAESLMSLITKRKQVQRADVLQKHDYANPFLRYQNENKINLSKNDSN